MKLSRKEMQPRMFYLVSTFNTSHLIPIPIIPIILCLTTVTYISTVQLTDVLLYTTPVANNQFRLNLSLPLEEIEVNTYWSLYSMPGYFFLKK